MAAPYVTADEILDLVGNASPSGEETAWAETCAAAVEAAIAARLGVVTGETATSGLEDELHRSAVLDGAAAYVSRKAPHGVLNLGPDGDAVRLGSDLLRSSEAVLARHTSQAGIGIG